MSEHAVGLSRLNKNAKGRQGAQITHELLAEIRCTRESQFEWQKCACVCVAIHVHIYKAESYTENLRIFYSKRKFLTPSGINE